MKEWNGVRKSEKCEGMEQGGKERNRIEREAVTRNKIEWEGMKYSKRKMK